MSIEKIFLLARFNKFCHTMKLIKKLDDKEPTSFMVILLDDLKIIKNF